MQLTVSFCEFVCDNIIKYAENVLLDSKLKLNEVKIDANYKDLSVDVHNPEVSLNIEVRRDA